MTGTVGTTTLVRLGFRRDRIILPVWVYAIAGLVLVTVTSFKSLYPTEASRIAFGATISGSPTLLALTGQLFNATTVGGLTAWRVGAIGGVLIALMNTFTVIRHSRAEEESGRLELLGAGVLGRAAALTAAVLTPVCVDVLIGLICAVGLIALGQPATGSLALGLAIAATGVVFAALAAFAAQLTESSRTANGIAAGLVGLSYLLRAVGDSAGATGPRWLSWMSPIGWGELVRPFADERWWLFALSLGLAALLLFGAYTLIGRRDLGAGLVAARPGPGSAAPSLRSPFALATRLQRGPLLGWLVAFVVLGAVYGSMAQSITSLLRTSAQVTRIIARMGGSTGLVNSFLAAIFSQLGMIAAVYGVWSALRLRGEETEGRIEPLLATSVGRIRWAASQLAFALLGPAVLLLVGGLAAGLAHGRSTGSVGPALRDALAGCLVQLPAVWVLVGVGVALFGLLPRLTSAAWGVLVALLVLAEFGPALDAPKWLLDIAPFTSVPKIPGGQFHGAALGWLLIIAALLIALGLAGFRRRDLG